MSLTIKEVKSSSDLTRFIKFYTKLYSKNKQVAFPLHMDEKNTLKKDKNPAHRFCECKYWLAYRDKKVVGRIAAIINKKELSKTNEEIGRFGWFDFIDDEKVSFLLMKTALKWLKQCSIEKVHGPMGFTDMDRQGLLISGFERKSTLATLYNYEYYEKHITNLGFEKSIDWVEYEVKTNDRVIQKMNLLAERAKQRNSLIDLKPRSVNKLKKIAPEIFNLINRSYKNLYGYIPLTKEQINFYTTNYLSFINLNLISLVGDESGKLIGLGIAMPSFTNALQKAKGRLFPTGIWHMYRALRKNNRLDLYLIAVDPEYQNKGINAVIMSDIINGANKLNINVAETNCELENNQKVQSMWRFLLNEQHKRRRCYIKNLTNE